MQSGSRWTRTVVLAALAGLLALVAGTPARANEPMGDDRFGPLAGLVGRWEGTSEKPDGSTPGVVEVVYAYALGGAFLRAETLVVFPSDVPERNVDIRRELVFLSRDGDAESFVARAFSSEGFVSRDPVSVAEGRFVRESQSIENGPDGMRLRYTTTLDDDDTLTELVEVEMPGLGFQPYQTRRLRRVAVW